MVYTYTNIKIYKLIKEKSFIKKGKEERGKDKHWNHYSPLKASQ